MLPIYTLPFVALLALASIAFAPKGTIGTCYYQFTMATGLIAQAPEALPEAEAVARMVKTASGEVEVSRTAGYRVLYHNEHDVPFVNLKVELSEPDRYEQDQAALLANLRYLNAASSGMESEVLLELSFNGHTLHGLSRSSIESGSTLGTFVLFPGEGITVYFYFNNLKPGFRHFEDAETYRALRDEFLEAYTQHLVACIKQ
jgi:hypothetical protein